MKPNRLKIALKHLVFLNVLLVHIVLSLTAAQAMPLSSVLDVGYFSESVEKKDDVISIEHFIASSLSAHSLQYDEKTLQDNAPLFWQLKQSKQTPVTAASLYQTQIFTKELLHRLAIIFDEHIKPSYFSLAKNFFSFGTSFAKQSVFTSQTYLES